MEIRVGSTTMESYSEEKRLDSTSNTAWGNVNV